MGTVTQTLSASAGLSPRFGCVLDGAATLGGCHTFKCLRDSAVGRFSGVNWTMARLASARIVEIMQQAAYKLA